MGEMADEIIDNMLGYRAGDFDEDDHDPYDGRRRGPPPRPETMSMFEDLDTPPVVRKWKTPLWRVWNPGRRSGTQRQEEDKAVPHHANPLRRK